MIKLKSIEDRQEILRQGAQTEFWSLLLGVCKESREDIAKKQLSDDMKELPANEYKLKNELFNVKKECIEKLEKLPQTLIDWLEKPENEEENFDPYDED